MHAPRASSPFNCNYLNICSTFIWKRGCQPEGRAERKALRWRSALPLRSGVIPQAQMCRAHTTKQKPSASWSWPNFCGRQLSDHLLSHGHRCIEEQERGSFPIPRIIIKSIILESTISSISLYPLFQCPNDILALSIDCFNCLPPYVTTYL